MSTTDQVKQRVESMDIWRAASRNDMEMLMYLLDSKLFDVNQTNRYNQTALHCAAWNGHWNATQVLLQHGGDVHKKDYDGETALHWAAGSGADDVVRLLLEHEADVNCVDENGQTPLMWASCNGHEVTCKLLLDLGADPELKNVEGETAKDVAQSEQIEYMLEHPDEVAPMVSPHYRQDSVQAGSSNESKSGEMAEQLQETGLQLYSEEADKGFKSGSFASSEPSEGSAVASGMSGSSAMVKDDEDGVQGESEAQASGTTVQLSKGSTGSLRSGPSTADEEGETMDWELETSELKFFEAVGVGGFGEVYAGSWRGTPVAIKKLLNQRLSDKDIRSFRDEISMMSKLRHPNIVLFMGACTKRNKELYIVTEFMPRGNLFELLHYSDETLEWNRKVSMARDIARGMNYLHCNKPYPIMHRDLKSSNLLVDAHYNVKVSDFGYTKIKTNTYAMTQCGTPQWMAPEVLRNENYNEKADVYSYGVVLWEMLTGNIPYDGQHPLQVAIQIATQNLRPEVPDEGDSTFIQLIKDCFNDDPAERPSFDEVLRILDGVKLS